ncbi:unnamed protein product [Lathyrus oleraceus]
MMHHFAGIGTTPLVWCVMLCS